MDRRELLIGSALLALVAACRSGERATDGAGTAAADEIRSRLPRQPGGGSTDLAVRAVNGLGATLYRSVASSQPTVNAVLSPTTIAIALAMTREGAAGVTAAEIDRLLQIVDPASLPPAMNALDQALASRSGTRPDGAGRPIEVVLDVAGSLWGQQGLAVVADLRRRPGRPVRGWPTGHGLRRRSRRRPGDDQRLGARSDRRQGSAAAVILGSG